MVLSLKKLGLAKSANTNNMSAAVADGYLVLSLLNAREPKIWRMELNKIGTATFEIKTNEKDDAAKLILKPKKGTAEIIASFESKEEALEALTLASNALRHQSFDNTSKVMQTNASSKENQKTQKSNPSGKWGVLGLGFLLIIGLYLYLTTLMPPAAIELENTATQNQNGQTTNGQQTGVPLSADDFLNGL